MAKKHFSGLFAKSGKILSGHNCAKEFDEQTIGKVRNINDILTKIEVKLSGELEKCTDMFRQSQPSNRKNKKRSEKQNRRKAKKRKAMRESENVEKVRQLISNTATLEVIDSHNLNVEAQASVSACQIKYLKIIYQKTC